MRVGPAVLLLASALAAFAGGALAAPGSADLSASLALAPGDPAANLESGVPATVNVTVKNAGDEASNATEVDVWSSDASWPRHSIALPSIQPGASLVLVDPNPYTAASAGPQTFYLQVDPADRVDESDRSNNAANLTLVFSSMSFVNVDTRLAGDREIPPYTSVCFVLRVAEGQSVLFQAESKSGAPFDQYLMDQAGWAAYRRASATGGGQVAYLKDYSFTDTNHVAFTTAPLPAGTYFLLIENDEKLAHGASPAGFVNVTFAVAQVNNALPVAALAIIIGAAAAAVWATVKWRPAFDIRSPLLEVPPPDPSDLEEDDAPFEEGEGEPPRPADRPKPPRPPRERGA